jgi:hypothetical protein
MTRNCRILRTVTIPRLRAMKHWQPRRGGEGDGVSLPDTLIEQDCPCRRCCPPCTLRRRRWRAPRLASSHPAGAFRRGVRRREIPRCRSERRKEQHDAKLHPSCRACRGISPSSFTERRESGARRKCPEEKERGQGVRVSRRPDHQEVIRSSYQAFRIASRAWVPEVPSSNAHRHHSNANCRTRHLQHHVAM